MNTSVPDMDPLQRAGWEEVLLELSAGFILRLQDRDCLLLGRQCCVPSCEGMKWRSPRLRQAKKPRARTTFPYLPGHQMLAGPPEAKITLSSKVPEKEFTARLN